MYLSRLDLHGFKSFAQKTSVAFSPGVTAIVGPNGCGKSNVIDAVRWVLGEQRSRLLRSESMGGVIFNGAAGRKPLGMAEVSLTVENTRGVLPTEYTEVTVTRRLYRNGDSDYLLNGTVCRLRDVLDLFMDTGMGAGAYSVIELSMVEDILSENAADRRRLFEEAAGVTKYKRRREQTFKRLAATRTDLTRLDDIVEEVDKQVRALERQASKARKHARLADRLRRLELALAAHDHARLQSEREAREAEARESADAAEGHGARLATGEAALEGDRTALVGLERALAECSAEGAAHADRVRGLDAERRVEAERLAGATRTLDRLAAEEADADARRAALAAETETTAARLGQSDAALADAAAGLADAEARRARAVQTESAARATLDAARTALATATRVAGDARAARDRTRDRRALYDTEVARTAEALASLDDRLAGADRVDAAREALVQAEAALGDAAETLVARARERDAAREAEGAVRAAEQTARSVRDAARAEAALLDTLLEAGDGTDGAVDALRRHPDVRAVTVAETVACDPADRPALAAALGPYADGVVVGTEAEADAAIALLRAAEAGRATFLVLDRLPDRPAAEGTPVPPGATPALALARTSDARVGPLLQALLGGVFVVPTLADARRLREGSPAARFVTRDGAWTDGLGAVHAGSESEPEGAGRFGLRERQTAVAAALTSAEAVLARAEAETARAREAVGAAEAQRTQAEAARDAARSAADTARTAAARLDAEASARAGERSRLDARLADLAAQTAALAPDHVLDDAAEAAKAEATHAEAARDAARHVLDAAEAERRSAEAVWNDARLAQARATSDAAARRSDLARLSAEAATLDRRAATRQDERARLTEAIQAAAAREAALAAALDAERTRTDALLTATAAAETAVLDARARISDAEGALRAVRAAREEALRVRSAAELRLAEIATRQETTAERLADDHGATLDDAEAELDRLAAEEPFQPDAA
ncbi:MAG TPA: chromosome segregation protein SMC, partial [Rubricoccaceae bacterium]